MLWPPAAGGAAFASGNSASVVLSVSGGGVPASVYLADLNADAQRALVASGRLPARVEVVKVAHHGSADRDAATYACLDARIALISAGAGNDYGHPRDSLLATLASTHTVVARTDQEGLVLVAAGAQGLRLWRSRASAAPVTAVPSAH